MLSGHQRIALRRAGLRVEDELPSTFVVILDHPTPADAYKRIDGMIRPKGRLADIPSRLLEFVAFRLRRHDYVAMVKLSDDLTRIDPAPEWSVIILDDEPDADGVSWVPQLDDRGLQAMAFLRAFAAGLGA